LCLAGVAAVPVLFYEVLLNALPGATVLHKVQSCPWIQGISLLEILYSHNRLPLETKETLS